MADLIDRKMAIDAVRSYYDECDEQEESIEERIERLPSADIDLSGFSDKLWKTAYERGKADAVRSINERGDMISRQTAMNAFAEYVKRSNNSDFAPVPRWNDAVEIVENLPSVDAVEVVRCKDCKWFNDIGCSIRIVDDSDKPTENDYCSYGSK